MYGPLAALYTEMFGTRTRYTGASLGYQVSATGAGLAPVVFASMSGGGVSSLAISALIAASCVITAVSIMATKESHRAELGERPDATDAPGEPAVQS
jgi:hypothetical protein